MKNLSVRILTGLLVAVCMLSIAGCGGGADGSSSNTNVRLLNLSTGYESLDLYANNGDTETDTTMFTGITLGTLSSYTAIKGDEYVLKFRRTGTSGNLVSTAVNLAGGTYLTLVAMGGTNQFSLDVIDEDIDAPSSGYTSIQIVNTSLDDGFDFYLTGPSDSLDDVAADVANVAPRSQSGAFTVSSGTYRLRITKSGSKTDVRLNIPQLTLPSTGVLTIIVREEDGGVLVNAMILPKRGQPTIYQNTSNSQFRVLNVSVGYEALDVLTSNSDGDTEVQQFTGITRGATTDYASVPAATYTFKFRRTGAAGNLLSLSSTLAEDRHTTFIAYGALNDFSVVPIDEEISRPDPGYTKIQVLNATSADRLDVYLTDANDLLSNVSAAVSGVAAGTLTEFTTVRRGTYRLRITRAGEKADLRLDVPEITLDNQGVLSIILNETAGGVLLDAVLLPQQAAPVRLDNGNVRIRGAVGLPSGSLATVSVSTTDIVSQRSARSFISDSYTILPSGTVPVSIYVDNVLVASQTVALLPGRDYTLLVWESGGTKRISLIADSNFASANLRPRLRLLNAASGLAAPLTLLADYSPVAEYIHVGAASAVAELSSGTNVRFDVLNSDTLVMLLTRESVALQLDGVYTLFVAGGGSSAVSGTLRKDR